MRLLQENALLVQKHPLRRKPLVISNITLHALKCPSLKRTHSSYGNFLPYNVKPLVILNIIFHALECPSLKRTHSSYGNFLPYNNVNLWSFQISLFESSSAPPSRERTQENALVVWESPLQRKPLVILIIMFHALECPPVKGVLSL